MSFRLFGLLVLVTACLVYPLDRPQLERSDLRMNQCSGFVMKFPPHRRIYVDKHCNDAVSAVVVQGAGSPHCNGVYETYGRVLGAEKYELVLDNGTTFTLSRVQSPRRTTTSISWAIHRNGKVLYVSEHGKGMRPPESGWSVAAAEAPPPSLRPFSLPKVKLRARRSDITLRRDNVEPCRLSVDGEDEESCGGESALLSMLHPAVGPELGALLNRRYKSALPTEAITVDGFLEPKALAEALTFKDVELSSWIGPEEAFYCCEKKYRLNFTKWPRSNARVRGVQELLSSNTFISFLEKLTGIDDLIPMTADDERMLWAGSSLIAIAPGGYLHVHNDFNYQNGMYRRINVLLYLNENWDEEWQGHLELWDRNVTRCLQRILPVFNRMSIFTVMDDAFHGHPLPSAAPPGHNRYALQLVYYTRHPPMDRGGKSSSPATRKGTYPAVHGAIFQPPCVDSPDLNMTYICSPAFAHKSHGGQPICECNFRTS